MKFWTDVINTSYDGSSCVIQYSNGLLLIAAMFHVVTLTVVSIGISFETIWRSLERVKMMPTKTSTATMEAIPPYKDILGDCLVHSLKRDDASDGFVGIILCLLRRLVGKLVEGDGEEGDGVE
uniref:Uncharacterized protein n=1 Tax=Norrisiella sphaerica TaxID=552664 RepID=A0A7S2VVF5_9EUKA